MGRKSSAPTNCQSFAFLFFALLNNVFFFILIHMASLNMRYASLKSYFKAAGFIYDVSAVICLNISKGYDLYY